MQYLMWMKSKQSVMNNSSLQAPMSSSYNNNNNNNNTSWEEQAFAEDGAGPLGGFVWPPRSYSCTFCRREFRSAQALGGHMNVHRRDRARLKQQSLCNNNNETTLDPLLPAGLTHDDDHHDHHQEYPNSSPDDDHHHHSEGSNNSNGSSTGLFAANSSPFISSSPNYNSRASVAAAISQENSSAEEEAYLMISPFSASTDNIHISREPQRSFRLPYSSSSSPPDDRHHHSNSVLRLLRSRNHHDEDRAVETNLSVGINSNFKRLKSSSSSSAASFPFYHKPCSSEHQRCPLIFQFSSGTIDDIDLELRLGDAPAVK